MIGFLLSAICSGSPMKLDKLHFLSQAAENDFLKFKRRGPFQFSKKYPAAKHYTDIYRLELLLTHLSFRLTVPLMSVLNRCLRYRWCQISSDQSTLNHFLFWISPRTWNRIRKPKIQLMKKNTRGRKCRGIVPLNFQVGRTSTFNSSFPIPNSSL